MTTSKRFVINSIDHWNKLRGLAGDVDPGAQFVESSKIGQYDDFPSQETIYGRMLELVESLDYKGYPSIVLPHPKPVDQPLSRVISSRVSARIIRPCQLDMDELAALLHYAYGITRTNEGTGFSRPFRSAPSGGGLYPLEIYFHSVHVRGLKPGLYHYNPAKNEARLLICGDLSQSIAETLVQFQSHIAHQASAIFFLTALFERSTFKYGTRGYRFILVEAGHVAQNFNLVATGLGLGCLDIGGFYDRAVDKLLGIDGVSHSTIYMVAVSARIEESGTDSS
jgi:SagB-type dehydrogenase family enzyme